MKVLVTNTVLLNGGDAAILMALMRHIRRLFGEDTEIVVADTQPEVSRRFYPELQIIPPIYHHIFPPKRPGRFSRVRGALRFARWYSGVPRLYAAAALLRIGRRGTARALTTEAEWSTLEEYASADVVISTGGTYLVENYWLGPRIFDFRLSLRLGKPLVLYTQSIGRFGDGRARRALQSIFRKAALVLLRDEASLANVRDIAGADLVRTCVAADAVFSLAEPEDVERAASGRAGFGKAASDKAASSKAASGSDAAAGEEPPGRPLRIAISVRDWPFFRTVSAAEGMDRYTSGIAQLVEHLIAARDAEVVFISTCQGVKDYTYDDSRTAKAVRDRLSPEARARVHVTDGFHRPEEIIEMLKDVDLVVATRMHMAILALVAGTPVLPIAYEFKTQALFERLEMSGIVHDIEDIRGDRLIQTADEMIDDLAGVRSQLFPGVQEECERAAQAVGCMRSALGPHSRKAPQDADS